jgi:hypothetical protein
LPWEPSEYQTLKTLFHKGYTLEMMCNCMERSSAGILAKLVDVGCVGFDTVSMSYYYSPSSVNKDYEDYIDPDATKASKPKTQPKKENIMAKINKIEIKTFINDIDAATLSDEQIFAKIAELEALGKSYASISTKPQKLIKAMETVQQNINDLVAYVDSRL